MGEFVGSAEIARRLGLKHRQDVHDLRRKHRDFPEPVPTPTRTLLWWWHDVEAWATEARKDGRLP